MPCGCLRSRSSWSFGPSRVVAGGAAVRNGLLVLALALGLYGVVLTRESLGDLFLPRIVLEGSVDQLDVRSGSRSIAVHRYVLVGGRWYQVPYDVFMRLRPGIAIRGEIGAGSGMLLNVKL